MKVLKSLLFIAVLLVLFQGALFYTGISFTSEKARDVLVKHIQSFTQREAVIDGEVRISVSLFPELLVERLHIRNKEGYGKEDLVAVSEVRVQISLLRLLTGDIHLEELSAAHAEIGLIQKKDGSNNWHFDHLLEAAESVSEQDRKTSTRTGKRSRLSIGVFELEDITFNYEHRSYDQVIEKHIARVMIDLQDEESPRALISGSLEDYGYDFNLKSDSFSKLASGEPWEVDGEGTIADRKTRVDAVMQLRDHAIEGNIDVNVQNINLGLLLEHFGIITGEDAECRELNIKTDLKGEDLIEIIQSAKIVLQLEQGFWRWQARLIDETRELVFEKASVRTSWKKPVDLHIDGKLFNETIKLDFTTNRLSEFFDDIDRLDIDLSAHVAGSDISLKGSLDLPVKKRQFQLDISLRGNDLEKLNRILNSELPPFNDYSLNGKISSNPKGFVIRADEASIGDSHFKAAIAIDTSSFKPFWTLKLNSRQLQIKDFEFADRQVEIPEVKAISAKLIQKSGELKEKPGRRLKQIVNDPKMHCDLDLRVEKVLAGKTALGPSRVNLMLRDNSLIINNAEFDVPGGKIKSSAVFKTEKKQVEGAFKLDIDKFDYGAVARYFNLSFEEGGVISARIDLELVGRDFSRLFDHATGKLDVALWPRNTQTEIFDIWATNLLLIILPEIRKKEDRINCIVALMNLEDGIMTEDFFGIDTRKVWMYGNIHVDFRKDQLQLSLYPSSKKARLFAVQAPIRVAGNFNDIRLTTNPVDLTAAYFSFITSPLHVPARRILDDKVPEDASETCEKFFDRDYVKKLKEKIEQEEQKEIDEWLDSD